MQHIANFQPATIYAPTSGTWRIQWYNLHPETDILTRVQKTFDLNRIRDKAERRKVATTFKNLINEALKNGYNYFVDSQEIEPKAVQERHGLSIMELMQKMLAVRCVGIEKKRTIQSYTSFTNVFCDWLVEAKYHNLPPDAFKPAHWMEFITYKSSNGSGNRNINDYTNYFKTTFKKARKLQYMTTSPLDDIDFLQQKESSRFEPLTIEELKQVAEKLMKENMHYYIYTKLTSHEYIRPYHIAFIRAKDIDYEKNIIRTYGESSKNSRINEKQLLPEIKQLLIHHGYHQLPGEWYLFGKDFLPNEKPYPSLSKRSAELWKRYVIDGLGINKKMYALKHTTATHYITHAQHVDVAWLQQQMEHSTLEQTNIYIKKRTVKAANNKDINLPDY